MVDDAEAGLLLDKLCPLIQGWEQDTGCQCSGLVTLLGGNLEGTGLPGLTASHREVLRNLLGPHGPTIYKILKIRAKHEEDKQSEQSLPEHCYAGN